MAASASPRRAASSHLFELLLACCSGRNIDSQLLADIDPDCLIESASRHGVLPRVYDSASATFPADLRVRFRQAYDIHTRRALCLTSELLRVLDHLQGVGISVLPYKGPVLSQMLYGDVAARQYGDLDLLVRAADVLLAKAALKELGYSTTLQLRAREERAYVQSGYEYVFDRGPERNLIELHWRTLPWLYSVEFSVEESFERSTTINLAGRRIATICREDLLLVLCVHAAKHAWTNLSWLCDVAALVRTPNFNWIAVEERARKLGIQRIVSITIKLANALLRCGISDFSFDDPEVAAIARVLELRLRTEHDIDPGSPEYFSLMMRVRERWQDRLRLNSRLVFTPTVGDWKSLKLPDQLFPLYRLVRLTRIFGKLTCAASFSPFRRSRPASRLA